MQKGTHRPEELQYWSSVFRSVKATFLLYGCILIQRHAEERAAFSVRLQKGPHSGPAETDWALAWNTVAPGGTHLRIDSRVPAPVRSPHLYLAVLHGMQDGALVPQEYLLRVKHPFEVECKCPAGWRRCWNSATARIPALRSWIPERKWGDSRGYRERRSLPHILRTLISIRFLGDSGTPRSGSTRSA